MKDNKNNNIWKLTTIAAVLLLAVVSVLYGLGVGWKKKAADKATDKETKQLSLWTADAKAKTELESYVKAVTDEKSPDFIPVERRIAVFDLDGTLYGETNPTYFDYSLVIHRVLEDPDYKDKATDFERETANAIVAMLRGEPEPDELEVDNARVLASAFSGMTVDEFSDYVADFLNQPAPGYEGMTRGESFYKPMLEVVDYLKANDFTIYVISGTERFMIRQIAGETLGIPNSQFKGTDLSLVASGQGTTDSLHYVFTDNDEVLWGGELLVENIKMNKVSVIVQEIGEQPVLSFGNSSGDVSMAEYVTTNNPYRSLAFMLCCDDTEREYGNIEKADSMLALCKEQDWIPVSMKNDWTTIYGDGVKKTSDKKPFPFDVDDN